MGNEFGCVINCTPEQKEHFLKLCRKDKQYVYLDHLLDLGQKEFDTQDE